MTFIYDRLSQEDIASRLLADDCASWTRDGARALAEYLLELAEDSDEPRRLDITAIRCQWYEGDLSDLLEETGCESLEDLETQTTVLKVNLRTVSKVHDDRYIIERF